MSEQRCCQGCNHPNMKLEEFTYSDPQDKLRDECKKFYLCYICQRTSMYEMVRTQHNIPKRITEHRRLLSAITLIGNFVIDAIEGDQ